MTGKNLPNTVISIHPQCLDMLDLAEVQDPDADTYREMAAKAVRPIQRMLEISARLGL